MRRMTTRRIVIVGATAGAVLLTGGVAFAFWSSTGTAAGAAEVASDPTLDLVVTQVGTPIGLFPGGSPVDIVANIENPSGTAIQLADVTVTVADVVDSGGVTIGTGCPTTDFAIADAAYAGELIPAGGTTADHAVATIRLKETGVDQDACKGASVVLSLVAN